MNKKDIKLLLKILAKNSENEEAKKLIKKLEKEIEPIKITSRKSKGREFQKFICQKISEYTNIPWGYEDDMEIQPRLMGQSGVDIILRNNAKKLFPFAVEAKNQESLSLWKTIEQSQANLADFKFWIVMYKKNGRKPIVILDFNDFLDIYFKNRD